MRNRRVVALLSTSVFAALAVPAAATAPADAAGSSLYGCPSQYVCLYTNKQSASVDPSGPHTNYKYYGYDNFSNVVGRHWLVNNQTGGAKVYPCYGYNGTNCTFDVPSLHGPLHYLPPGSALNADFTPINSIKLTS